MDTARLAAQRQSLPFFDWYASSPHQLVTPGDGMMDLLFGNPQDMPIPAYVDALRRHLEPEDPGWFAYKLNEPGATTVGRGGSPPPYRSPVGGAGRRHHERRLGGHRGRHPDAHRARR